MWQVVCYIYCGINILISIFTEVIGTEEDFVSLFNG